MFGRWMIAVATSIRVATVQIPQSPTDDQPVRLIENVRTLFDGIGDSQYRPFCAWYAGYLQVKAGNISEALKEMKQIPDEHSGLRTDLALEIMRATAQRVVAEGRVDEPISDSRVETWRKQYRTEFLAECGIAQARRGDWSGMNRTLALLNEILRQADRKDRDIVLRKVARVHVAAGQFNDAHSILMRVTSDVWDRDRELIAGACKAAEVGDYSSARRMAQDTAMDIGRVRVVLAIALRNQSEVFENNRLQ